MRALDWHWQNLSTGDRSRRRFPWHGRVFLQTGAGDEARLEWDLRNRGWSAAVLVSSTHEDAIGGHAALPPVALYWGMSLSAQRVQLRRLLERVAGGPSDLGGTSGGRTVRVGVHDGALWWGLWIDPDGWTNKRSRWRDGRFSFLDALLGADKHSVRVVHRTPVFVPMPEGTYAGVCELREETWSRKRWFSKHVRRANIEMKEPVPFPGKGSGSWNCGEDALHSLTTEASTVSAAVSAVVASVLESRERYGSLDYVPVSHRKKGAP